MEGGDGGRRWRAARCRRRDAGGEEIVLEAALDEAALEMALEMALAMSLWRWRCRRR